MKLRVPGRKSCSLSIRGSEKNKSARLRRILVRIQGASTGAYWWICAGGCNAVDGPKDKQDGGCIFFRGPKVRS